MQELDIHNFTEMVKSAGKEKARNPRLVGCVHLLVEHLHTLVKELKMTETEMMRDCEFLNEVGKQNKMNTLLALLGLEALIDMIAHPQISGVTPST